MTSKILTTWWAAPVAAVAFGVLTLGLDLAVVPLDILTHHTGLGGPVADGLSTAAVVVPAVAVGTLLAARRPRNPIGWVLLTILLLGVSPTNQYAVLDYRMHHGTLPLGWAVVVLGSGWPLFLALIAILLWLFPDGRLAPGRWRRMAVALVIYRGATRAGRLGSRRCGRRRARYPHRGQRQPRPPSKAGPGRFSKSRRPSRTVAALLAWLVVQVPSYRRSADQRRQQLKWLYTGSTVFRSPCCLTSSLSRWPWGCRRVWAAGGQRSLQPRGGRPLPVCIGVAVLKYRLYEIDRIISRVISYAIITAVLAGVFAGLVLLATEVLPFKAPVAVAASTLTAAALFNPLRRRVQRVVDRRFNRATTTPTRSWLPSPPGCARPSTPTLHRTI